MKVTTNFGTVKIVMLKGEKGEAGEKGYFEDLTEEQIESLKSDIRAYYKKVEGTYTTTGELEQTIPINVAGYTSADVLTVNIEGLNLVDGVDYTINGNNITLVEPITHIGTRVNFCALRSFAVNVSDFDELKAEEAHRAYETVAAMLADENLTNGIIVRTLGFHSAGDGGAALYLISSTGTANGMDVLACENGLYASLVVNDYVTPQMYGAKGDGVTNDTAAIQAAISSGYNVRFPNANYICQTVNVNSSNILIDGGESTINFGGFSGFSIPATSHDIVIKNFNSVCTYVKDSDATTNTHIAIIGGAEGKFFAYNITIDNCSFNGGVMGISASSAKNMVIVNCDFNGFVFKPSDSAGGYGILLQSCINVKVLQSSFSLGKYGRHDVYVSVDQRKSADIMCENIVIDACSFDHSELELDGNNHFYSDVTVPINVRSSKMVSVSNSYFYSTVGILTLYSDDGAINGVTVSKCVIDTPVFNNGANELKYVINVIGTNYLAEITVDSVTVLNEPNNYQSFASLRKCVAKIINCDIGATRILCANDVTLQIDNITTKITYYVIRFNSSGQTNGYCRNLIFLENLIGDKYYFASGASVSDGFFQHGYSEKSYTNATYCYRNTEVARYGDIVQCSIGVLKDLPQNTVTTLFTLDEEHRPRKEVVFTLITRDASKNLVQGWVKTSGELQVYNLSNVTSGNLNVNETISYIGAN